MKRMSGKRNVSDKGQARFPVIYDGWPFVYAPASPAALHLLEILNVLPDTVRACIALPAAETALSTAELIDSKAQVSLHSESVPDTVSGRLRWEQRVLGRMARAQQAGLIHTTTLHPPLFGSCPVIVSPAEAAPNADNPEGGLMGRVRSAAGKGGLSAAQYVLWPEDLPVPAWKQAVQPLPPFVHEAFTTRMHRPADLPEYYVLAAGPVTGAELDLLAAAWSWAFSGLGEDWVLLVGDLDAKDQERMLERCHAAGIADSVRFITMGRPRERAGIMQHASAVMLAGAVTPWGDAYLQALAAARPLAAQERAWEDARVGAAGYLNPPDDARALGAAVLTMIIEEQVGETLREAARQRSAGWNKGAYRARLLDIYVEAVPSAAGGLLSAGE